MKSPRKIFTPIAVSLSAAAAVMVLAVVGAALTINQQAKMQQLALLNNGLAGRVQEIAHQVATQVVWDDAVQHLDNQFDPVWAKANIGAFLYTTDGFDEAMVLDRANHPIYAMRAGADVDPAQVGAPDPAVQPLIVWVRRAEARRPLSPAPDWAKLMKTPLQASAFAKIAGRLRLVTATLVQPDFGHSMPSPRAPIVITYRNLDDAFVSSLGGRFMLKDLKVGPPAGRDGVLLSGAGGEPLARLTWTPDQPGLDLLSRGLPFILILLGALALVAWALHGQAKRAADDLIASEARANHLALHDTLTGLPNVRLFDDRLTHALAQARRAKRRTALTLIDIGLSREVAESSGHAIGDDWIKQIAERLKETCRKSDTLARLSADRFAVIQADASAAGVAVLSERILTAIKTPVSSPAGALLANAAIGATVSVDSRLEPADLMRQAQVALYRARELGWGQACFFEPEMDAALRLRKTLESDLRQALIDDALDVHYQPQVNGVGAIIGVEALARWNHPGRGLISPSIFIQIAEESGLIGPLGLFILKRAFEDSVRWPHLKVAINMTSRQLNLPGLTDDITALLAKFDAAPERFEIEVREDALLEEGEQTETVLKLLRARGLTVALDNFGAGRSNIGLLGRYPINTIKIDRAFVSPLGIDPEADEVVSALVKLARAYNLDVIAEGVETRDQHERVMAAGCLKAQGFLFSRPLTAEAVEVLIRESAASKAKAR
jgi:diguanylate cyclase (GGDEF)-like protein